MISVVSSGRLKSGGCGPIRVIFPYLILKSLLLLTLLRVLVLVRWRLSLAIDVGIEMVAMSTSDRKAEVRQGL